MANMGLMVSVCGNVPGAADGFNGAIGKCVGQCPQCS